MLFRLRFGRLFWRFWVFGLLRIPLPVFRRSPCLLLRLCLGLVEGYGLGCRGVLCCFRIVLGVGFSFQVPMMCVFLWFLFPFFGKELVSWWFVMFVEDKRLFALGFWWEVFK